MEGLEGTTFAFLLCFFSFDVGSLGGIIYLLTSIAQWKMNPSPLMSESSK
jgi:hypothetical protein